MLLGELTSDEFRLLAPDEQAAALRETAVFLYDFAWGEGRQLNDANLLRRPELASQAIRLSGPPPAERERWIEQTIAALAQAIRPSDG